MTDQTEHPTTEDCDEDCPTIDRGQFETRVDALEVRQATHRLQLRHVEQELTDGKEKFKNVAETLQEHEIAIQLLKAMKDDITEIKAAVQKWQELEHQSRGAWKVIVAVATVVAAAIGMVIQGVISHFFKV
jgi:hypothetical protein